MTHESYYSKTPHGGYKKLASFQMAEIVCDFTMEFCPRYVRPGSRTRDQMEQAARSGKQNIAEGSQASAANPKTELKLVDVARASLEELKLDYEDFLRQNNLPRWAKDDKRTLAIRKLAYEENKSYATYRTYIGDGESAENCALCLINQANYLLDRQLASLRAAIEEKGLTMETREQRWARAFKQNEKREQEFDAIIKAQLEGKNRTDR